MSGGGEDRGGVVDALYRITRLVGETEDPKVALGLILDEIVRVFAASSASIALINPDTQALEIEVYRGLPSGSEDLLLRPGQGITGWVALHGQPLLVPDVARDPRYVPLRETIRAEMAVPMEEQGAVIGVVNVDSETLDAFDERDLKLLTLLTAEATRVVGRLWLIRQLKVKADQMEALLDASQELVATRDEGRLLAALAASARVATRADAASIHLLSPDRAGLVLAVHVGGDPAPAAGPVPLGDTALGTVVTRGKVVEIHDLSRTEEHFFSPDVARPVAASLAAAPLRFEDEVFGVVSVLTRRHHRFSNDEKRLLSTVAALGGVALQNARLYARAFATEEILRRNDRLTTLGLLAAEIAHEIRNPLTVIRLLFESLSLDFPGNDPRGQDVRVISEKLDQLEAIVSRVLSFGKSREGLHARYAIAPLVQDTLHLVRLKLQQQKVDLAYEAGDGPLAVEGHKGQLQQALLNLLLNATQAMPRGGAIHVRTHRVEVEGAPCVAIDVADTGPGIPEGLGDRIFDSFLTGRQDGTGLGLAITKRIARSHRGDVQVLSTSTAGTTFRLWLPLPARAP